MLVVLEEEDHVVAGLQLGSELELPAAAVVDGAHVPPLEVGHLSNDANHLDLVSARSIPTGLLNLRA